MVDKKITLWAFSAIDEFKTPSSFGVDGMGGGIYQMKKVANRSIGQEIQLAILLTPCGFEGAHGKRRS